MCLQLGGGGSSSSPRAPEERELHKVRYLTPGPAEQVAAEGGQGSGPEQAPCVAGGQGGLPARPRGPGQVRSRCQGYHLVITFR